MGFVAFFVTFIAAVASLQGVHAAAVSEKRGTGQLRWEGPVFRDQAWKPVYASSVDTLWDEVLKTNREFVMDVPSLSEMDQHVPGRLVCGSNTKIATADSRQIEAIMTRLRGLGGKWMIEGNRCHRIACRDKVGVYWCNDNKHNIVTSAVEIHLRLSRISRGCCNLNGVFNGSPLSGVHFFPANHREAAHSNLVIGYADCKDPANTDPARYRFPGPVGGGTCQA